MMKDLVSELMGIAKALRNVVVAALHEFKCAVICDRRFTMKRRAHVDVMLKASRFCHR